MYSPQTTSAHSPDGWTPLSLFDQHPLSIPELYKFTADHNPAHPAFVYHHGDGDDTQGLRTLTHGQVYNAIRQGARLVKERVDGPMDLGEGGSDGPIGILAVLGVHFASSSP